MRALVLLVAVAVGLGFTVVYPFAGVLIWEWFSLQNPHQEAYGWVQGLPLNFAIAALTLVALFISAERKLPPLGAISVLIILFLAWITFNSFFAVDPAWSWPYWSRTWKTLLLGLVLAGTARTRLRMYGALWIAVISLFYFGVKGGAFTLVTGGRYHVFGPAGTEIADNNALAVALLMALPLANYLRCQVANKYVKFALAAGCVLTAISVLGTYSRGAFVGLAVLVGLSLLRTKRRFTYLGLVTIFAVFALAFMPAHFLQRMQTIGSADQDSSFQGRLMAWRVAFVYASDHFPFGAGFYGPQLASVFHRYFPGQLPHAAHSIYFQVLGEHGFIGLVLYILLLAAALLQTVLIARRARPDQEWARDLALALQASLIVFCVSGALLSIAYYDLFILDISLLLPLAELVGSPRRRLALSDSARASADGVASVPAV